MVISGCFRNYRPVAEPVKHQHPPHTATSGTENAVAFAESFLQRPVLAENVKASEHAVPPDYIYNSLERAAANPDSNDFDALVSLAASMLRELPPPPMPRFLSIFVADVLEGKRKRPTRRGADKYKNFERDYKFHKAVQEVAKRFHLPRYSHNELSSKPTAAGIVSQAAGCGRDKVIRAYQRMNSWGRNNRRNSAPRP